MGILNKDELIAGGLAEGVTEWTQGKFGGELLSTILGNSTGDVTSIFNDALVRMNTNKRPLIIDRSISISGVNAIAGYCVIQCTEDAWINITGGSQGIRAENTYADVGAWTAVPTLVTSPDSTGSVVTAFTVDTASFTALSVGDAVYIKDDVPNTFTYNSTNDCGLAEICSVIEKRGGNTIVLSRVIGDMSMYSTSGRIYKLDDNPCYLKLNIKGDKVTPRSAVRIHGYVNPKFDLDVDGNSSAGLFVVSCHGGGGKVRAKDLINDPTNNRYGYAVITYGACYGMHFDIRATRCRHAYTDGILAFTGMMSGVSRNNMVTGVAIDCSAASWDTHPNSDGQRFINIAAWGTNNSTTQSSSGLNQAVQIRGTNVVIDGLQTNIRKGIMYTVNAVRDSHTRVRGVKQDTVVSGTPSTLNGQYSVTFLRRDGTGTHKFTMSDCPLVHALNYQSGLVWDFDSHSNCTFELSTSSSTFPAIGNTAGSRHVFDRCIFINPTNMQLSSTDLIEMTGCVIKQTTTTRSFNAGADAKFRFFQCGIILEAGGNINNSAFIYASGNNVTGQYANLWVSDGRAAGTIVAFKGDGFTGHIVKKL